jgi:hypothetical protein
MKISEARFCAGISNLLLWTILGVLGFIGCAEHKAYRSNVALIPKRCMHAITVDDFTQPCREVKGKPNEALCDKVHIRFACLDYSK